MDLDIDAVSLASYAFDKSGKYVLHSPYANIDTMENLRASEKLPFPTGQTLEIGGNTILDYSDYISQGHYDIGKPFNIIMGPTGTELRLNTKNPRALEKLGDLIQRCNDLGYIPFSTNNDWNNLLELIKNYINEHNEYLYDDSVEDFSKNFIVTSMYNIGISPANLIGSQQAMDAITGPLKIAANATRKAAEEALSLGNPGSFTTNIHGISQNMGGKQGIGISAVGLKGFFAATARYNEVLSKGDLHELDRLRSKVKIGGVTYEMLANVYTENQDSINRLAEILNKVDLTEDKSLVLSAILSLAVDNAKELSLDKLNADKFLGLYIYGTAIGVSFDTLAKLIGSDTGRVIAELMSSNAFNDESGLNIQNVFDYVELGPELISKDLTDLGLKVFNTYLLQEKLCDLSRNTAMSLQDKLNFLENLKLKDDVALNNLIEKALDYIEIIDTIYFKDLVSITDNNRVERWFGNGLIYEEFKKLNDGGEEMRKLGLLLHINQGLESLYISAINYLDSFSSAIYDRKYAAYRAMKRDVILKNRLITDPKKKLKLPNIPSNKWKFNVNKFVSDIDYRNAWIDIYGGIINREMFKKGGVYTEEILKAADLINSKVYENFKADDSQDEIKRYWLFIEAVSTNTQFRNEVADKLLTEIHLADNRAFFNILDIMQIPHFMEYLTAADMLHQSQMAISAKYRTVYRLGIPAAETIGAFSQKDKEKILARTELYVDRLIRDRFLVNTGYVIRVPQGYDYFVETYDEIERKTATNSSTLIRLGTRAGNATFKYLMETKIIPDLLAGKIGGNMKDMVLTHNSFIKSLALTPYKNNVDFKPTINYAPSINMSPRSDADKALFEQVKYDFNLLKTYGIKYKIGGNSYNLIDLFWIYNQIAFNGRPGENTMTSIFKDISDLKLINLYKEYINYIDNNLDFANEISITNIIREVAPKANPWITNLNYFYHESSESGKMAFWKKERNSSNQDLSDLGIDGEYKSLVRGKYNYSVLDYANEETRNYVSTQLDLDARVLITKLDNGEANIVISKGLISDIYYIDKDNTKHIINIPYKLFDNIPTIPVITASGASVDYDMNYISMMVDRLITDLLNNCG